MASHEPFYAAAPHLWDSHLVGHVEVSADGVTALTASFDQTALLWDVATAKPLRRFPCDRWTGNGGLLSADGKRVLLPGFGGTAVVWDTVTGQPVRTLSHDESVWPVALSPDGKRALVGAGKVAVLWDVDTGAKVRTFSPGRERVTEVLLTADGKRVVTATFADQVTVWEAATGNPVRTVKRYQALAVVAVNRDGTRLLIGGGKGAEVIDVTKGEAVTTLQGHTQEVYAVALSPDGKWAVTGSDDGTAVVWDAETGKKVLVLAGHARKVRAVWVRPDGRLVATGSGDCSAVLWDPATGKRVTSLAGWQTEGANVAFAAAADGTRGLMDVGDKAVLWDVAGAPRTRTLVEPPGGIEGAAMTEESKAVVTCGSEGRVALWDVASGRQLWAAPERLQGKVATDRTATRVLTEGMPGGALLYDPAKRERLQRLDGHNLRVTSLWLSGDGKRALTTALSEAIVWDTAKGKQLHTFRQKDVGGDVAALSRDGRRVLTVGESGRAVVWDAESGREVYGVRLNPVEVPQAALSPDGKRAVVAWQSGEVDILDEGTPKPRTVRANTYRCDVFLARGGRLLVTADIDGTVGFWDADAGTEICRLVIAPNGSDWLAVAPDGRFDASVGYRDALGHRVKRTNRFVPLADADRKLRTPGLLEKLLAVEPPKR